MFRKHNFRYNLSHEIKNNHLLQRLNMNARLKKWIALGLRYDQSDLEKEYLRIKSPAVSKFSLVNAHFISHLSRFF